MIKWKEAESRRNSEENRGNRIRCRKQFYAQMYRRTGTTDDECKKTLELQYSHVTSYP